MDKQAILEELLALLAQNGIAVRNEAMGGSGGGLCTIKDKPIVFLDSQAQTADKAVVCADAVNETIDIEKIYIRPEIRQFLQKHKTSGLSEEQ